MKRSSKLPQQRQQLLGICRQFFVFGKFNRALDISDALFRLLRQQIHLPSEEVQPSRVLLDFERCRENGKMMREVLFEGVEDR